MGRHILSVDVISTNNSHILHLFDSSEYSDDLGVSCGRLEITIPGFRKVRLIETEPNFNLGINGINLDIISKNADYFPELPDGIYHIKYSISPNKLVFVEFDHLRTTVIDNLLLKARNDLDMSACTSDAVTKKNLLIIREIEDYIKAAVAAIEICDDVDKGTTLFTYSKQLLDRYLSTC